MDEMLEERTVESAVLYRPIDLACLGAVGLQLKAHRLEDVFVRRHACGGMQV